jgi:hypothetical protein
MLGRKGRLHFGEVFCDVLQDAGIAHLAEH